LASFVVITSLFILFSDLFPKRLGMAEPENMVVRLAQPMVFLMTVMRPLVWFYSKGADALFRLLGMSSLRDDRITSDDILAMMEAGARRACWPRASSRSSPMCLSSIRAWCLVPCHHAIALPFFCATSRTP
jgi:Hemolysins and related proteins containing CBS domains